MPEQTPKTAVDLIQVENPQPVPVEFVSFPIEKRDPDVESMLEAGLPIEQAVVAANVVLDSMRKVDIEDRQKRVDEYKKLSDETFKRKEAEHVAEETQAALQDARIDSITGLRNSNSFKEFMSSLNNREHAAGEYTFGRIDVDNLKKVNDDLGHKLGDRYLKIVAKAVASQIRKTDYEFRVGGDEIVVVLDRSHDEGPDSPDIIEDIFERIRAEIQDQLVEDELLRGISGLGVSIGVATNGEDESIKDTDHRADILMYDEKTSKKATAELARLRELQEQPETSMNTNNLYSKIGLWFNREKTKDLVLQNTVTERQGLGVLFDQLKQYYPGITARLAYIFQQEQELANRTDLNRSKLESSFVVHDDVWYDRIQQEKKELTNYTYQLLKRFATDSKFDETLIIQ